MEIVVHQQTPAAGPARLPRSPFGLLGSAVLAAPAAAPLPTATIETVPGMPPVLEPGQSLQRRRGRRAEPGDGRGIDPNLCAEPRSNDVYVIDPAAFRVVDRFPVGVNPQHVVPSWDLQTLWVANNGAPARMTAA